MKNNQLKELFGSLNKNELKEFSKFLRSPFFNNRSEVIRYFDAIKKFWPEFNTKNLNEENLFSKVYTGKKFSNVLMRKLNSLTTNLLLDFFAITGYQECKLDYNVKLVEMLYTKKLFHLFEKKKNAIDELFNKSERSFPYYEAKYKYTTIVNGFAMNLNERSMLNMLQNEIDDFIEHFLSVALLLYIRLGEWERGTNIKYDLKFYDEVMKYLSLNKTEEVTLATLYYNMLKMLETGEEKYFFELQRSREKFAEKLCFNDDYNIGVVSIQFCYKRIEKGDIRFRKDQFEITKNILTKNLLPEGFVEPYFFTNAVRNAVNVNELKWAEKFIKEYKGRLNSDIQEEITAYSTAILEFGKKDFIKSLNNLSKINLERSFMKLEIKNLLLMNYYELGYTEEIISLIDTYKHFLHRETKLSEQFKKANSLFLSLVSELVKAVAKKDSHSANELKMKIESTPYFSLQDWLLNKINELLK